MDSYSGAFVTLHSAVRAARAVEEKAKRAECNKEDCAELARSTSDIAMLLEIVASSDPAPLLAVEGAVADAFDASLDVLEQADGFVDKHGQTSMRLLSSLAVRNELSTLQSRIETAFQALTMALMLANLKLQDEQNAAQTTLEEQMSSLMSAMQLGQPAETPYAA